MEEPDSGKKVGGNLKISPTVLKDDSMVQTSGRTDARVATIKTTYVVIRDVAVTNPGPFFTRVFNAPSSILKAWFYRGS